MKLQEIERVMQSYGKQLIQVEIGEAVLYAPNDYEHVEHYKCGPNHNKVLTLLIPDKVYFNREGPCKVHDFMYTYPKDAKEDYRIASDCLFKINMDKAAEQQSKLKYGSALAKPFNNIFFYFVKWWGRKSFYLDKEIKYTGQA